MPVEPLKIRIQTDGERQSEASIRRTAGFMDAVAASAMRANREMGKGADGAKQFEQSAKQTRSVIRDVGEQTHRAEQNALSLARAYRKGTDELKEMASAGKEVLSNSIKTWEIYKAVRSGGPISLFNAVVPEGIKRKIGLGLIGAGLGEGAMLGQAVAAAGQMESVRAGLGVNLRGSGVSVDDMIEQLKKFDADSQLDFLESTKTANQMIAQGVDPRQVISYMRAIGDAVGAMGGGQDEFQGIARALTQIKAKGKYSAEEGQQLAERGINASKILSEKTGISQADIIAGNHDIGGDKAVDLILEGMREKFAGGMEEAAQTFQGQVSTLRGAIFQLQASLGQYLLPAVTAVVGVANKAVNVFNAMPEPLKQIVAYSAAFNAGLLILAGTFLIIAGPIATTYTIFKLLTWTIPLVNASLLQLAWGLVSGVVASVGLVIAAIGTLAVVAASLYYGWKGWEAAETKSAAELEYQWGALGRFWVTAGDLLEKIWNHPLLAWLHGGSDTAKGDKDSRELWEMDNARRRKRGEREQSYEEFQGDPNADEKSETVEEVRKRKEGDLTPKSAIRDEQELAAKPFTGIDLSGLNPLTLGVAEAELRGQQSAEVQAIQAQIDALQAEIYALQDKKRTASKEEKELIAAHLTEKQRQLSALKRNLAAQKTLSRQQEREADQAEKDQRMLDKIDSDAAYDEKIEGLENQLADAKESADSTRVKALMAQIAREKAQQQYDEDIINARDEENTAHKAALEKAAAKRRDNTIKKGERAAKRAEFEMAKAELKEQFKDEMEAMSKALHPAQIRALFNATGARMNGGGMGFPALGADINYGDRFAGMKPSLWGQNDLQAMREGIQGVGDFGATNRTQMEKERRIRIKSMTENSKGERTIKFFVEDLVLPPSGLDEVMI